MNVYDFDKTIYEGDSSVDFFVFCLFQYPLLLFYIPYQLLFIVAYKFHLCNKEKEKSAFFSFIKFIPNLNEKVQLFWENNIKHIADWYLKQQREDDVIISASPEFLLSHACKMLGISRLIATKVDEKKGILLGRNCYGEEKVHRFNHFFFNESVESFYTDSYSDAPMARLAKHSYIVKNGNIKKFTN